MEKKRFDEIHEDLRIKGMPIKDRIEQYVTITSDIIITRWKQHHLLACIEDIEAYTNIRYNAKANEIRTKKRPGKEANMKLSTDFRDMKKRRSVKRRYMMEDTRSDRW